MDDLEVDTEFTTLISDDEEADATAAIVECLRETLEQLALVDDGEALLDITSLSHGDDTAVITDVEDAVLLEDGAEHVLYDDRWGWVRYEAGLLMKLLGEQINTEVAVLAGLGRSGNPDHLARAPLQDQEVADADVVAGNGDGVWRHFAGVGR
jgi:hypothetical protein